MHSNCLFSLCAPLVDGDDGIKSTCLLARLLLVLQLVTITGTQSPSAYNLRSISIARYQELRDLRPRVILRT